MTTQTFKPSPKYLSKFRLALSLVALIVLASGILLALLIGLDQYTSRQAVEVIIIATVALDLLWWIPAMLLSAPYYKSLSYEIQDDEVVVRAGIITQSVKHVPYRTVTNLTIKRGLLDRWFFDLGTLNIQTAGMSGTTGAEESLVGLPNYKEVYEMVATELRRFRGAMAPTTTDMDMEIEPTGLSTDTLGEILSEVRAIRIAIQH